MAVVDKANVRKPWQSEVVERDKRRKEDNSHVYNSRRWKLERRAFFAANPLCVLCFAKGIYTSANTLDHIQPIRLGGDVWLRSNWQGLCASCHAVKSAGERHMTRGEGVSDL